jgi:probable HAF family extracellular repeat protein
MHASTRRVIALGLGLGLSVPALAQHGRPPLFYEVVSISTKEFTIFPGGDAAEGRDINNLGEVVGWGRTSTGQTHAFKRALLGSTIDLGAGHPWNDTVAEGINDNSEVVGYRAAFGGHMRGFYWSPGDGFQNLSFANPPGVEHWRDYYASAINNHGRIVGWTSLTGRSDSVAVTWWHHSADPSLFYTAPAGIANWVFDISDSGWFTGAEYTPSNAHHRVYRYRAGTLEYPATPWPTAQDQNTYAVNEAGTVVGSATDWDTGAQRAIRWRRTGPPLILGVLPGGMKSEAYDINETGFIVGHSTMAVLPDTTVAVQRAFLFHSDFGMVELPPPSSSGSALSTFCAANALNDLKDNGLLQATGYCTRNGQTQAVRWDVFVGEHP